MITGVPSSIARPRVRPPRLGVRGKFIAAVGVLMAAVLGVSAVAASGLVTMVREADTLYTENLATAQHSADLVAATLTVHKAALYQLATTDPKIADRLTNELDAVLLPTVYRTVSALRADVRNDSTANAAITRIEAALRDYLMLHTAYEEISAIGAPAEAKSKLADQTDVMLTDVVELARELNAEENRQAVANKRAFDNTYQATRNLLVSSVAVALLLGLVVTVSLSRNLLPRIRQYSAFANDIAADRPTAPLAPRSQDELTVLGAALNAMVDQRATASLAQDRQTEFVETLQVTDSEEEAHLLIRRHLIRSIAADEVLVLKRNNSANRLEAATDLAATSDLAQRLIRVDPSACLALRLGRGHQEGANDSLLSCRLCSNRQHRSTCEPLTVSGEVIGSVLVSHQRPIDADARTRIRNTVAQAAPMLANLRNLALAEFRANNDPLTGLPNKRATEETLKRMVAQANRSISPFSAVMLDLDHFKQINDRYGHALGDDVLAAVGAAIRSCLRESDFGGRFGGEEFLVLLPDTDAVGAMQVAERIRATIAALQIPGVDREITASLGVAGLLEHAGSSLGLLREADRAQYAAKAAGRNQAKLAAVEPFTPEPEPPAPPSGTVPSQQAHG